MKLLWEVTPSALIAHTRVPWGGIWWQSINYVLITFLGAVHSWAMYQVERYDGALPAPSPGLGGTDDLGRFMESLPSVLRILKSRREVGVDLWHTQSKFSLLGTHLSDHGAIALKERWSDSERFQSHMLSSQAYPKFLEGKDLPWISLASSSAFGEVLCTQ